MGNANAMSERDLVESHLFRIVEHLDARPSGGGFIARCPAHHDKTPSLSISEKAGKILLHCFAGCTFDSVLAAMSADVRDIVVNGAATSENGKCLVSLPNMTTATKTGT